MAPLCVYHGLLSEHEYKSDDSSLMYSPYIMDGRNCASFPRAFLSTVDMHQTSQCQ